jgi:hypothetical protein
MSVTGESAGTTIMPRTGAAPEHGPAHLLALRAEQVVGEGEIDFAREHVAGGVGRGAAQLEVEVHAAFGGHVADDRIPEAGRDLQVVLVHRREIVGRLSGRRGAGAQAEGQGREARLEKSGHVVISKKRAGGTLDSGTTIAYFLYAIYCLDFLTAWRHKIATARFVQPLCPAC